MCCYHCRSSTLAEALPYDRLQSYFGFRNKLSKIEAAVEELLLDGVVIEALQISRKSQTPARLKVSTRAFLDE
jgi:hypothetical protein